MVVKWLPLPWLSACSGPQSTLAPAGPAAQAVAELWWAMAAFAAGVLVVVVGLWLYAMGRSPRDLSPEQARRVGRRWIVGGGLVLPITAIVALLAFAIPIGHRLLPLPLPEQTPLRIDVVGHQWWWEVRYPDARVTAANRLHLPVGQPVDVHVSSADVIHSFWVPRLGGKIDAIPGITNVIRLYADRPGVFRGQCAEFCGAQHARMILSVEAQASRAFDAWLSARQAAQTDAQTPAP